MSKGLTDTRFIMGFQAQRHWDRKVAFYLYSQSRGRMPKSIWIVSDFSSGCRDKRFT